MAKKVKTFFTKEDQKHVHDRLDEFFEDTGGFVFVATNTDNKISDLYVGICPHHVLESVTNMVMDAAEHGYLAKCDCDHKDS